MRNIVTRDDLNYVVGLDVMGWHWRDGYWYDENHKHTGFPSDWDPCDWLGTEVVIREIMRRGWSWWTASKAILPSSESQQNVHYPVHIACIRSDPDRGTFAEGRSDESLAHAICLAALNAVEHKEL